MSPLQRLRATRSRVFRRSEAPKTPEPMDLGEIEQEPPALPRQRLRIKRRTASQFSTEPTEQFLADVATADVPIPSIEEPAPSDDYMVDPSNDIPSFPGSDSTYIARDGASLRSRSPPKTPAPVVIPDAAPQLYHDWSIDSHLSGLESSPDYESSRPSTARSTQTSASAFSRFSFTSDELSECASPEPESQERFDAFLRVEDAEKTVRASEHQPARRRAHWLRPMSQHLWSTYMAYLQDPKVTPIRIGKSGIPPQGVLLRVSREARRSWKGIKTQVAAPEVVKSGSTTPTAEAANPHAHWPHTDAATRAHLRDLCRANAGNTTRNVQYLAQSPTPFGKSAARRWNRRTPGRSPSVFSGNEMAVSLAVCTSESMQPQGPLAELTRSEPQMSYLQELPPLLAEPALKTPTRGARDEIPRLGSPFVAKSYGPSSSSTLMDSFGVETEPQRHSQTIGPKQNLQSAIMTRSRSNTQKRRHGQAPVEVRKSKRPSLASDLWSEPGASPIAPPSDSSPLSRSLGSAQNETRAPRSNLQKLFETSNPPAFNLGAAHIASEAPARLGSPFTGPLLSSFSFPSRHSGFSALGHSGARRPYGSVQHIPDREASPVPPRTSLESRLAYLDERLKDFRHRDAHPRRSESPF